MTYTCQIRVASAMIKKVKRARSKTRPQNPPPAGVRMVPGIDATASTRPSSAPGPVTRSTSHVRATRKAWSASIESPAPAHSRREALAFKGIQKRSASNRLSTPTPRARRTLFSRSTNLLPWLYCLNDIEGGIVTRSYITNLRKGRIENPGFEKLKAIAKVMDFPPELWFEESPALRDGAPIDPVPRHLSVAEKTNRLFDIIKNETTGRPYTNAEVARLSLGDLTEEHLKQIRAGKLTDPSMKQVVTLAEVFGVHPTYFLDSTRKLPLLDQEAMSIFRDETVSAIAHKSLHLPGREKQMILGIIRQFEGAHQVDDER